MKKLFLFIFFTTILSYSAKCIENSLLWKVSGNGLQKPSYLFGTNHVFPSVFLDSVYMFHPIFDSVETVIVETYVDKTSRQAILSKFKDSLYLMPNNLKYKDLYNEIDLKEIDSLFMIYFKCKSEKMNLKPSIVTLFITTTIAMQNINANKQQTLEGYIMSKAKNTMKLLYGLETTEENLNGISGWYKNIKDDANVLLDFIKNQAAAIDKINTINNGYREQNLSILETYYTDNIANSIDVSNKLLKNRNLKWIPKIEEKIKTKQSFIAVGALHLVGEFGLINQLRELGYKVEPIME